MCSMTEHNEQHEGIYFTLYRRMSLLANTAGELNRDFKHSISMIPRPDANSSTSRISLDIFKTKLDHNYLHSMLLAIFNFKKF